MQIEGSITPKTNVIASRFERIARACEATMSHGIELATIEVHARAVEGVQKLSMGELQTRYNPKRVRRASIPGDPPNVDTGVFVRSIQFFVDHTRGFGIVGTNDKRGPWFEFGTSTMEKRPWLTPAWKNAQRAIRRIFRELKIKVE